MAEDKQEEEAPEELEGEASSGGKKKLTLLGGGVVGLVAVAWAASLMAVPSEPKTPAFSGPFVAPLSDQKIQVNLKGESGRRFLVMSLNAVYDAYEESYVAMRLSDALYAPLLMDAIIDLGSQKDREQVSSPAEKDIFKQELRSAVDPILFPIHVGAALTPYLIDDESGLGPGESVYGSTLRGPHHEHVVHLDVPKGTIRLDEGDEMTFSGDETDLELVGPHGKVVYLSLTDVEPDFQGEVHIGVQGRVRRVTFSEFLIQ